MTRHTVKTDKPGDLRGFYCVQDDLSPRFLHCAALNLGVPPGWFGTFAASYCPIRLGEHPKLISTEYSQLKKKSQKVSASTIMTFR